MESTAQRSRARWRDPLSVRDAPRNPASDDPSGTWTRSVARGRLCGERLSEGYMSLRLMLVGVAKDGLGALQFQSQVRHCVDTPEGTLIVPYANTERKSLAAI